MDNGEDAQRLRLRKARQSIREGYAELCYYYPQYRIEDLVADETPIALGDMELLLSFARMRHYQDLLDELQITTAAQSKKGYKSMVSDLKKTINRIRKKL